MTSSGSSADRSLDERVPPALYGSLGDAVPVPDEMFDRIVRQVTEICASLESMEGAEPVEASSTVEQAAFRGDSHAELLDSSSAVSSHRVAPPNVPEHLRALGFPVRVISELILKQLYLQGPLLTGVLADQVRLPEPVLCDVFESLQADRLIMRESEVSDRFMLTELGRGQARDAFARCRYLGPAPVSLADYATLCQRQSVGLVGCGETGLRAALRHLTLTDDLFQALGPAICDGQSLLLFGPSGNGKSSLAAGIARYIGEQSPIYVPYALAINEHIVTVYDPTLHRAVGRNEPGLCPVDARWRLVRRPSVRVGTEGQLHQPLASTASHIASLPLHLKANGGTLLLDDFGRQQVSMPALLGRWLVPLAERKETIRLADGQTVVVPMESLMILATHLPLEAFADPGFLRRIRHKLPLHGPTRSQYLQIFQRECEHLGVPWRAEFVTQLFAARYNRDNPPRMSDPQDLLNTAMAICRFKEQRPSLTMETLSEAFDRCLGHLPLKATG